MQDVVVVGAGPTGLWLAGELRLGGASVTVVEARTERDPHSKALTVHPRTLEIFDCRGVLDRFLAEGGRIPRGHFGSLPDLLDFSVLDTPYPFTLALPQRRTEELLEERALAMGATIRRGVRVAGLTAEGIELEGGEVLAARYVAGCDGARSTIRQAAGIDFPGTATTTWGWLGDVTLDAPPATGTAMFSGAEGGLMVVPLPGGVHRLVGIDPGSHRPDWPGELGLDELRATVRRIAGTDYGMRDPRWLSRFGNATRQASAYRAGRVLLAGDAAHMHFPAGGVGMNVGIQDAHNLGWKLAAVVTGRADEALLDTYHEERHPVGAALLRDTRAQTALMASFTPETLALRTVLSGLIASTPDLSRQLAERLSGLDVAYAAGRRVPDRDGLFARLRTGEHVATAAGPVRPDGHPA
ncbi:putative aromatic compound monooxygenase YhjG [Actinoplanes sp. OR16]|uniref:FAD-dependent monooxygenase n=1 Tax=Actinoplanes sp. OR16 TaxID=946334 RepID=UPI000F6FE500|nr:FAD-dependent monooxygenase [Actinoplanes sp. OR16]BBH71766.1 putative aromatic compound monooxygenase YhjG [Actinoplanes sp. OR16]